MIPIRDRPLRVKISLGIFLCIVLLTIIGTIVNSVIIRNEFIRTIDRDTANTFLYYLEKVNNTTNTMIDNGRSVSLVGETLYQIYLTGAPFNIETVIERFLVQKVSQIPIILGSGLWYEPYVFGPGRKFLGPYAYWEKGQVKATWEYNTPEYNYPAREWYRIGIPKDGEAAGAAGKRRVAISRPYLDYLDRKQVIFITMAIPMHNLQGEFIGVSSTDWSLEVIHQYLSFFKNFSYTPHSFVMLIDGVDGKIIYHADRSLIMKPFSDQALSRVIDYKVVSSKNVGIVRDVSLDGRDYNVFYQRSDAGFLFIMAVPPAELYVRAVRTLVVYILLSFIVVGLVIFLVARIIDVSVIRRIQVINERINAIKKGDLSGNISFNEHDELSTIADNIGEMSETILLRERQLEGLQRYLANVIESMPLMLVSISRDGSVMHCNRTFASFAGIETCKASGKNLWELLPQFSKYRPLFIEAIESKKPRHLYREMIDMYHERYFNISIFPLLGTDESDGVFLIEDISEIEKKNMQLRLSEMRYQTLFDSTQDAIFLMIEDRYIDCNRTALRMFGCTREQVIGETLQRFSPLRQPDGRDSGETAEEMIHAAFSGTPQFFEWRYRRLDGTEFDSEVNLNKVEIKEQNLLFIIVRDITDRKKTEEAIRTSEQRYRTLYRDNPSMFFTLDASLKVISVNEFGASQLGYSIDELVGEPVIGVFYEPDRPAVIEQLNTCLQNPLHVYSWQFRKVRKDGSLMWVEEYARAVTGLDGALDIFIVCQNITIRKNFERLLQIQRNLGVRLNSINELDEAMEMVLSSAMEIEGLDSGALYLIDETSGELGLSCSAGLSSAFFECEGCSGKDMHDAQCIGAGTPVYITGAEAPGTEPGTRLVKVMRAERLQSLAVIPVQYGGVSIACMYLGSHVGGDIPQAVRNALESISSMTGDTIIRLRAQEQIRSSLREKEVLLKEVHHRVKNNLQIIVSLLSLQSGNVKDPELVKQFNEAEDRIRTMAAIHEELYKSGNYADIDFENYIRTLVEGLISGYLHLTTEVGLSLNMESAPLGINQAVPLGLIINEIITNSLKHAFPAGRTEAAAISISLVRDDRDTIRLVVRDNGIGIPDGIDLDSTDSFGMTLIRILVQQLRGRISLSREGGTAYTLVFRKE